MASPSSSVTAAGEQRGTLRSGGELVLQERPLLRRGPVHQRHLRGAMGEQANISGRSSGRSGRSARAGGGSTRGDLEDDGGRVRRVAVQPDQVRTGHQGTILLRRPLANTATRSCRPAAVVTWWYTPKRAPRAAATPRRTASRSARRAVRANGTVEPWRAATEVQVRQHAAIGDMTPKARQAHHDTSGRPAGAERRRRYDPTVELQVADLCGRGLRGEELQT